MRHDRHSARISLHPRSCASHLQYIPKVSDSHRYALLRHTSQPRSDMRTESRPVCGALTAVHPQAAYDFIACLFSFLAGNQKGLLPPDNPRGLRIDRPANDHNLGRIKVGQCAQTQACFPGIFAKGSSGAVNVRLYSSIDRGTVFTVQGRE